jgi:hypothetical protein
MKRPPRKRRGPLAKRGSVPRLRNRKGPTPPVKRRLTRRTGSRGGRAENRLKSKTISTRTQTAQVRGLNAINRVRRGQTKTLTHAARIEGTTVPTIRRLFPAAFRLGGPGGRIRVRAIDPYSAWVEIITDQGPLEANARGSRQRELAGRHRAVVTRVLRGEEPASALKQFRRKKVGGHELLSDFDRLSALVEGGALDQLDSLYVSPETRP